MFLVNACCRLFMDADLNDGLTLCFARHSWACCEESAHDATSKVGELFEVRPLVSKAAGYCSSHRFIKPHSLSLMWLFLSVLLLCSHFFSLPSILLPLFPPTLSRSSRWFLVEASPTSRVGGAERRTAVALTAPRRELSTRFSTCQSQSALCRVRASTTVFYLFNFFLWHPFLFLYIQLRNVLKLESCVFCE